jgi:hypothetical protein
LEKCKSLPLGVHIQQDNTSREGKNQFLLRWCILLIIFGCVRWCTLGFLRTGHTHENIDQLFAQVCAVIRVKLWTVSIATAGPKHGHTISNREHLGCSQKLAGCSRVIPALPMKAKRLQKPIVNLPEARLESQTTSWKLSANRRVSDTKWVAARTVESFRGDPTFYIQHSRRGGKHIAAVVSLRAATKLGKYSSQGATRAAGSANTFRSPPSRADCMLEGMGGPSTSEFYRTRSPWGTSLLPHMPAGGYWPTVGRPWTRHV